MLGQSITGMAWMTSLGSDLTKTWDRLLSGECGLIQVKSSHRLQNNLAALVPGLSYFDTPMDRIDILAINTMSRALEDSGIKSDDPDLFCVIGTSFGHFLEDDELVSQSLYSWPIELRKRMGFVNDPIFVSTACSSGSDAILIGAKLIESGTAKYCLCGGVDVVTETKRMAHTALGTMSDSKLRSFNQIRNGTLLGEGAAFLVVEEKLSAEGRNAKVMGQLMGTGSSNDAAGMTIPDVSGRSAELAIDRALHNANIERSKIGLINAHGSGTQFNDALEAQVYKKLFGSFRPLIFATKGAFGHSLGATGAIEAVAVLLSLRTSLVPPICNFEEADKEFDLNLPQKGAVSILNNIEIGLSLTLGFGGFNTCLVFSK